MPDDSEWLPPEGAGGHDSVDLTAETRRLRVLGWRALVIAALWLVAAGLVTAAVFSLIGWGRWSLRHEAVSRTGWRPATVTVRPGPVRRYGHRPDLLVEYPDGSRAEPRATLSSHGSTRLRHQPGRPAWVGGSGREMVVLFETGRRPYAVPAYGRAPRTRPGT
jgi:hypothetical protein